MQVAENLGGLFGQQSAEVNHTHDHEHVGEHIHSSHESGHNRSHARHEQTDFKLKNSKDVQKNTERPIAIQKKSVDWSQYFGLDRRRKKAVYMARPDTREEDERYLLQKYYEVCYCLFLF